MKKILIVEDNEMNRDMLSRRLLRKGYDVKIAVDGEEGLKQMKEYSPDVVLMDMGLPVKDGELNRAEPELWVVLRLLPADAVADNSGACRGALHRTDRYLLIANCGAGVTPLACLIALPRLPLHAELQCPLRAWPSTKPGRAV